MNANWFRKSACLGSVSLVVISACATVDPGPDFERTAEIVSTRTRVEDVYNPDAEEMIEAKVADLLTDGLTVDEAVRVAMLNNRSFQAMFQEIGVSRAELVQSGLLTNPSLAFGVRFPEGGGRSELTLGLAQQLVDLWQIPVRKRIAEFQLEQTILRVAHRATELAAETRGKCYGLLALRERASVTRENLELLRRTHELVRKQVDAGARNPLDASLVRVAVMEVERELIAVERDAHTAEVALARVLGLSRWPNPWQLADVLPSVVLPVEDETALLQLAMSERLDAQAAAREVQSAEQTLEREYLEIFPNVTVGFDAERTENRAMPGRNVLADTARASVANGQLTAPSIQSRAERRQAHRQVIDAMLGPSIAVTLPVWDQNQAAIAKARFQAIEARHRYEDLLDAVAEQVQRTVIATKENGRLVRFYEQELLPQAEQNVEGARRIYELGEENVLVLLDAQKSLIQQRAAYVDARRAYAAAITDLEQALGGRFPPTPTTQSASSRPEE